MATATAAEVKRIRQSATDKINLKHQMVSIQSSINWAIKEIDVYKQNLNKLKQPTSALSNAEHDLTTVEASLECTKTTYNEAKSKMDHYEIMVEMLKDDGIKSVVLKKYLPLINNQVNVYLDAMDFYVGFEMNEIFDVVFKSRFMDKFKYGMFSEGQKARINLALMLTWRDIAKLKNSISTNLLVMDEVFDGSLDDEGSEELMSIFKALENQNVWVVSHKDLYVEKFDKVYKFVLERNFSQMEQLK